MQNNYYDELKLNMFPSGLFHQMGVNGKVSGSVYAVGEIPNAIAIVHGAVGCGYHYRYSARTRKGPNYEVASSELSEREIIFGGEDKLLQTILDVYETYKPELIAVIPTPVSDIIQDDLLAVVREASDRCKIPVIVSKSELFSHRDRNHARKRLKKLASQKMNDSKSLDIDITGCGYSEILCALVNQVMKPCDVIPKTVSLETIAWGISGNRVLKEIEDTLQQVNIQVTSYLPSTSVEDIKTLPSVALNIVRRTHWAKQMRERFGTPFLDIGAERYNGLAGIYNFYQDIGNVLGMADEMQVFLQKRKFQLENELQQVLTNIHTHKVYLITNNISGLPYLLKKYKESYHLNIVGCMVKLTKQTIKNSAITDELLGQLKERVSDSASLYYPDIDIQINPSWESIQERCEQVDVIIGTMDQSYEKLGKPIVSTYDYDISLSFESYSRSVKDLEYRLRTTQSKSHLILNQLPFDAEYYPLIAENSIIAGRKMWNKMWLERDGY